MSCSLWHVLSKQEVGRMCVEGPVRGIEKVYRTLEEAVGGSPKMTIYLCDIWVILDGEARETR